MKPAQPYLAALAPPVNPCPFVTCTSGLPATERGSYMGTVFSRRCCKACLAKLCTMGWEAAG